MISETGHNLIFIFSQPRSGSTLLSTILGAHSDIYAPPEPWILLRLNEIYGNPSCDKKYNDYTCGYAINEFMNEDLFIEASRKFAVSLINNKLKDNNKKIFVDKTPRYYHIISFINKLFPDAKKIWLKRNPLDVALSYKTTWNINFDSLESDNYIHNSFDFSLGLFNLYEYFKNNDSNKYQIKYEDFVFNPEIEIKKLLDFCKITYQNTILSFYNDEKILENLKKASMGDKKILSFGTITTNTIYKWKNELSFDEIKRIVDFIGTDIIINLGYSNVVNDLMNIFNISQNKKDLNNIIDIHKNKWITFERFLKANYNYLFKLSNRYNYIYELEKYEKEFIELKNNYNLLVLEKEQLFKTYETENIKKTIEINTLNDKLRKKESELSIANTELRKKEGELNKVNTELRKKEGELKHFKLFYNNINNSKIFRILKFLGFYR